MKVYVVMGNDYPDSVFINKVTAEDYCTKKKAEQDPTTRRIYWRVYEFEVR